MLDRNIRTVSKRASKIPPTKEEEIQIEVLDKTSFELVQAYTSLMIRVVSLKRSAGSTLLIKIRGFALS